MTDVLTTDERMAQARSDLLFSLREWKDAGGSIIAVIGAIEQYVMVSIARAKHPDVTTPQLEK